MNKLTQITDTLSCVKIPVNSYSYELEIEPDDDWYKLIFHHDNTDEESGFYGECIEYDIDIPEGNYKIIGKVSTTEIDFDPTNYVESQEWVNIFGHGTTYKNYTDNENLYLVADLSFRSLLSSKGITPTNETKVLILQRI